MGEKDKPNQQGSKDQPEVKKLDLKVVTKILKTPSESRTAKQCQELLDLIGDLQFFKQYKENPQSANVPKLCCKYMTIEVIDENKVIFDFDMGFGVLNQELLIYFQFIPPHLLPSIKFHSIYKGSIGNTFYVVLLGTVGIWIPKPKVEAEEKPKQKNQQPNFFDEFIKVKELQDGSSFGELALLNNMPRLATTRSESKTFLATLSKDNFNKILKEHEEQKLREEINFLQSVHAFKDLNSKQIRFLCLNNKILETQKNDIIFDEKDECNGLYIIKSGEFEIYKAVEKQFDQKEEQLKQNILSISVLNRNSIPKLQKFIKIKVLTVGELIGGEVLLGKKERQFRLVCLSQKGVIIQVKESDFIRKINEDSYIQTEFFKRIKCLATENEDRVQKRMEQFLEYKQYLFEDRLPVKLQQSLQRMYAHPHISSEQKYQNLAEFRNKLVAADEKNNMNEKQGIILSSNVVQKRFSNADSTKFQNQVEYLKFKRYSLMAEQAINSSSVLSLGSASTTSTRATLSPSNNDLNQTKGGLSPSKRAQIAQIDIDSTAIGLIAANSGQESQSQRPSQIDFLSASLVLQRNGEETKKQIQGRSNLSHDFSTALFNKANLVNKQTSEEVCVQTPVHNNKSNSHQRDNSLDISSKGTPLKERFEQGIGITTDPQPFIFGNERYKIPKQVSLTRDNYIRDWKKNRKGRADSSCEISDAQQDRLLSKIKLLAEKNKKLSIFQRTEESSFNQRSDIAQEQQTPERTRLSLFKANSSPKIVIKGGSVQLPKINLQKTEELLLVQPKTGFHMKKASIKMNYSSSKQLINSIEQISTIKPIQIQLEKISLSNKSILSS